MTALGNIENNKLDYNNEELQGERQKYAAALQFLEERTKFGINLGLQRIERLLNMLGNPHCSGKTKYIHIGGTNGKGSVSAFVSSMLRAAGYKCGVFASPHLHSYRERYMIDGEMISRAEMVRQIEDIKPLLLQMEEQGLEVPTEFEVSTALALKYFTEQEVDYAVMEVGLGGAIDSTNVITPQLSIITNVAMDHMDYLGNTPAEIASVKAGIIKPGVPALTASRDENVLNVLRRKALECETELQRIDSDFVVANAAHDDESQSFTYMDMQSGESLSDLHISLLGAHQLDNAALAVAAVRKLGLPESAIRSGLASARWAGRLEIVSHEPLIVLDGAHNVAGMQALSAALREYWANRRIVAVLGMLADKERRKALQELLPLVSEAVICRVPSYRAGDWQALADVCADFNVPCTLIEDVAEAVEAGRSLLKNADDMLLVSGSLYMLADARAYLLGVEPDV